MLTLKQYQRNVCTTFVASAELPALAFAYIQLAEEIGELLEAISNNTEAIRKETGDVLYWIAFLHQQLDIELEATYRLLPAEKGNIVGTSLPEELSRVVLNMAGHMKRVYRGDDHGTTVLSNGTVICINRHKQLASCLFQLLLVLYEACGDELLLIASENWDKLADRLKRNVIIGTGDDR